MDKTIIAFGDTGIEKHKFQYHKKEDVDINKIIVDGRLSDDN